MSKIQDSNFKNPLRGMNKKQNTLKFMEYSNRDSSGQGETYRYKCEYLKIEKYQINNLNLYLKNLKR